MQRWETDTRLPAMIDALAVPEDDARTRRILEMLGGEPEHVRERWIGVPAVLSRRLTFASGADVFVRDGAVEAIALHVAPPTAGSEPRGVVLGEWIGASEQATLNDLKAALGAPRKFAGLGTPYFVLRGAYLRTEFRDHRGWNDPGNLRSVVLTVDQPGLACRPEDDDCPTCSDLLVRTHEQIGHVDVEATTASLIAAVASGSLSENPGWVRLADLRALHRTRLMARVESQFTCAACRRIICFALVRDGRATFGYHVLNDARRHTLEPIPPVEKWGDATRAAAEVEAMTYVAHEPGAWFLMQQKGAYFLDARYAFGWMIDDSALVRLTEEETRAYLAEGRPAADRLARSIADDPPRREGSRFHGRDLFRSAEGRPFRDAVTAAIANHTWQAAQRDPGRGPRG